MADKPSLDELYNEHVGAKPSLDDIYNDHVVNAPEQKQSLGQTIGDSITRIPGVMANSLNEDLIQPALHPYDTMMAMGNAMFNHPVDNLKNTISGITPQGTMNYLANHPVGAIMNAAGAMGGVGNALGMAGKANDIAAMSNVGKIMTDAASVPGEVIPGAYKAITSLPKDYTPIIAKNAGELRQLINPGKADTKAVEILKGRDMNDFMTLAAQEKLIIGKSPTGKLDTTPAINQLKQPIETLDDTLQAQLQTKPGVVFNLDALAKKAAVDLKDKFPNAKAYQEALGELEAQINAEKDKWGGDKVSAADLNKLKRGMWSVSYDGLKPNNQIVAKTIGSVAQKAIEGAFPDGQIGAINSRMGDYLTLRKILENAHDRIIPGGKVGNAAARITGALALERIPIVGPVLGNALGGHLQDFLNDPMRRTTAMANRLNGYQMPELKMPAPEAITPEIMGGIKYRLPAPTPEYLAQRANAPIPDLGPNQLRPEMPIYGESPIPRIGVTDKTTIPMKIKPTLESKYDGPTQKAQAIKDTIITPRVPTQREIDIVNSAPKSAAERQKISRIMNKYNVKKLIKLQK